MKKNKAKVGIPTAFRPNAISQMLQKLQPLINDIEEIIVINGTPLKHQSINSEYETICRKYSNVSYYQPGKSGPSQSRRIISELIEPNDLVIYLDDDTFPSRENTFRSLINNYLENNEYDILAGIWNCSKNPNREFGSILIDSNNIIYRTDLKSNGVHRIDIPLATFITSGKIAKSLEFDRHIKFYGDMLDLGLTIKSKNLKCYYDSSIVFNHQNIKSPLSSSNEHRASHQWQYLSSKWNKSFAINDFIYTPNLVVPVSSDCSPSAKKPKIFIVEFNYYHWEVVESIVNLVVGQNFSITIIALGDKGGTLTRLEKSHANVDLNIFKDKDLALSFIAKNAKSSDVVFLSSAGEVIPNKSDKNSTTYSNSHLKITQAAVKNNNPRIIAIHHDIAMRSEINDVNHIPICLNPTASKVHKIKFINLAVPLIDKVKLKSSQNANYRWIGLVGLLEGKRRDYKSILNGYMDFISKCPESQLRIKIAGFCPEKEQNYWNSILKLIASRGCAEYIDTSLVSFQGRISDAELHDVLQQLTFLAYGINPVLKEQFPYVYSKMTGSFPLSLSNCLVPIIDARVATSYQLKRYSIIYNDCSNIEDAFSRANSLSDQDLATMRENLYDNCVRLAEQSKSQLYKLLSKDSIDN